MTTGVLITQNRQAKLAEQHRHLDLQISLLTERKVSKLIEMVEGLRRDLPSIRNRVDAEVEAGPGPLPYVDERLILLIHWWYTLKASCHWDILKNEREHEEKSQVCCWMITWSGR